MAIEYPLNTIRGNWKESLYLWTYDELNKAFDRIYEIENLFDPQSDLLLAKKVILLEDYPLLASLGNLPPQFCNFKNAFYPFDVGFKVPILSNGVQIKEGIPIGFNISVADDLKDEESLATNIRFQLGFSSGRTAYGSLQVEEAGSIAQANYQNGYQAIYVPNVPSLLSSTTITAFKF